MKTNFGIISLSFVDFVTIKEQVEEGLKNDTITGNVGSHDNNTKKFLVNFQKKKDGETSAVVIGGGESHNPQPYQPLVQKQPPTMTYYLYPYVEATQYKQSSFLVPPTQQPWAAPPHNPPQS